MKNELNTLIKKRDKIRLKDRELTDEIKKLRASKQKGVKKSVNANDNLRQTIKELRRLISEMRGLILLDGEDPRPTQKLRCEIVKQYPSWVVPQALIDVKRITRNKANEIYWEDRERVEENKP